MVLQDEQMRATKSFEERLERHIERLPESGCWIWMGAILKNGYGKVRDAEMKSVLAHRASYSHYKGNLLKDKYVCHTCDIPSCVNPNHLFLGTPTENQQDSKRKGRATKATFKLDRLKISEIKSYLNHGYSQKEIANLFNISQGMVSMINTKRAWSNE